MTALDILSDDEARAAQFMGARLDGFQGANRLKESYYEATLRTSLLGVAVPPQVASRISPVIGWASTVVDVLEERIDFLGWSGGGDEAAWLNAMYADNTLDVDAPMVHTDALLYGTSFVRVGVGGEGEPDVVVTTHSPRDTSGVWDTRSRSLASAFTLLPLSADGRAVLGGRAGEGAGEALLDLPGCTTRLVRPSETAPWQVLDRDMHGLPRVPVARLVNRPRSSAMGGRSEITPAVRYYCDAAVRTVLGMETNREFYSIPQLTLTGRGPDAFMDANGKPTSGWAAISGRVLAIDKDEEGDIPTISQLAVGSPAPFIDQVKAWAELLSAETGIPVSYLGLTSVNPTSADAIRAGEARLVKRARRRMTQFGRGWMDVATIALMLRDGGQVPTSLGRSVSAQWADPSTPTAAATADEIAKYVGAGVLPARSSVTWGRLGLSRAEQEAVAADLSAQDLTAGADNATAAGPFTGYS